MAAEKPLAHIIFGYHAVEEALRQGARPLGTLYLATRRESARTRHLAQLARSRGVKVKYVDSRTLDRVAGTGHQGVAATVEAKGALDLDTFLAAAEEEEKILVAVLDGVQDPRNLGAVLRNCSLSGAAALVLPRDRTAGITATVEKVAAGALEHVDVVRVGNLAAAMKKLKEKGFWITGADPEGEAELPEADFRGRAAIVFGDEHRGLRRLTREHCDRLVRIPSTGRIASYNMATASGLFLFAAYLQQREKPPSKSTK